MVLKRNSQRFFSADFHCVSASPHHFALFFFETGSLERFVVLEIPRYFLRRAKNWVVCCGDGDTDGGSDGCSECNGDGSDDGGGRGDGDSQR